MDNGLYFIRVEPAGGSRTENGGVLILRNGQILGGDAFYFYVGHYSGADGGWSGEFRTKQHTRSDLAKPIFGGDEVTVTFSGRYDEGAAEIQATALGDRYHVAMHRLADA